MDSTNSDSVNVPSLLEAWRNGDHRAAEVIFDRYQARLLRLVSGKLNERLRKRLDPEDLVLSIMRSAFRKTAASDEGFKDETGFWKWLTSVALNKTSNRIKREMCGKRDFRKDEGADSVLGDRILHEPTADDVANVAELLEKILANLDDVQGKILLAKLDGYSHEEIAKELGVSTKTIQRNGHKIRDAAMEVLGQDLPPWLSPAEPTLAEQFEECLQEPLEDWLPASMLREKGLNPQVKLQQAFTADWADETLLNALRNETNPNRAEAKKSQDAVSPKGKHTRDVPDMFVVAVYLLAIATAWLRFGKKISSASDAQIVDRVQRLLRNDWLDNTSRDRLSLFLQSFAKMK